MSPSEPDRLAGILAICLFLASLGCASLALQPPPGILVAIDWHLGPYAAAPILWSALMSVCVPLSEQTHMPQPMPRIDFEMLSERLRHQNPLSGIF
jgi:hypothetical protein